MRSKYFTEKEVNCFDKMNKTLIDMLEQAREVAGVPFKITSSWRSPEWNAEIGGKSNSAHLRGTAVDIACNTSHRRLLILDALLSTGFTRIGISKSFIHADCDMDLPQEVMWVY